MVKRISSGGTFFKKFLFPSIFLISGTFVFTFALLNLRSWGAGPLIFTLFWLMMILAFISNDRYLRIKLVSIDQSYLHISNYIKSITVPLSDVVYIEKRDLGNRGWSVFVWVIHLRTETVFGREIMFSPVPDHKLPDRGGAEDLVKNIPAW
jgi:hypothetical protein